MVLEFKGVNLPNVIKQKLIEVLEEWLDRNGKIIGEKWENKIRKEIGKFRTQRATIPRVAGFAMWCFCTINNLGVISTIGQNGYAISDTAWKRGFDKKTTERLVLWCSEAIKLTNIPKDVAKQLGWE